MQAATQVLDLVDELELHDIVLEHIDLGGGLGIRYRDEQVPDISLYAQKLYPLLVGRRHQLILEPGRSLVGNAGILLTRVEQVKHTPGKSFVLVDAGMNDLMRPSLYQAWHEIWSLQQQSTVSFKEYDVVGPVCESGDFFAKARALPELAAGEMIAIMSAGAYGMSMSSNYNSRQRPAEILVDDAEARLIRRRETLEQLWESEIFAEEVRVDATD
jgi:diaminopimelate decarboxylase